MLFGFWLLALAMLESGSILLESKRIVSARIVRYAMPDRFRVRQRCRPGEEFQPGAPDRS